MVFCVTSLASVAGVHVGVGWCPPLLVVLVLVPGMIDGSGSPPPLIRCHNISHLQNRIHLKQCHHTSHAAVLYSNSHSPQPTPRWWLEAAGRKWQLLTACDSLQQLPDTPPASCHQQTTGESQPAQQQRQPSMWGPGWHQHLLSIWIWRWNVFIWCLNLDASIWLIQSQISNLDALWTTLFVGLFLKIAFISMFYNKFYNSRYVRVFLQTPLQFDFNLKTEQWYQSRNTNCTNNELHNILCR